MTYIASVGKRVNRNLNDLFLLFALCASNTSVIAQCRSNKDSCFILAENKKIPLFSKLSFLKKELLISRDIDWPDSTIFVYGYDCKIRKYAKFRITPQFIFYVKTTSKETIKQELQIDIERGTESGDISHGDLRRILFEIKRQNLPFLEPPNNPVFGSSYRNNSIGYAYSLKISKVTNEYPANSWKEFTVTVSITKKENARK
jgi:hypothetical protein